jgi:D-alanine-D-alanine ligase-like ATP-grasp enzyme
MRGENEFFTLEVNTIPGMTELSFFPEAAAKGGSPFPQTCRRIVELSIEARHAERQP